MATAPEEFDPLFTINRPFHVGPCCCHYEERDEQPNRLVEVARNVAAATVLVGVGALAAVGFLTILVLTVFHGNPLV